MFWLHVSVPAEKVTFDLRDLLATLDPLLSYLVSYWDKMGFNPSKSNSLKLCQPTPSTTTNIPIYPMESPSQFILKGNHLVNVYEAMEHQKV